MIPSSVRVHTWLLLLSDHSVTASFTKWGWQYSLVVMNLESCGQCLLHTWKIIACCMSSFEQNCEAYKGLTWPTHTVQVSDQRQLSYWAIDSWWLQGYHQHSTPNRCSVNFPLLQWLAGFTYDSCKLWNKLSTDQHTYWRYKYSASSVFCSKMWLLPWIVYWHSALGMETLRQTH